MNSKRISILTTVAALGWFALPVQAVPAFSEIDKDQDGFISATESIAMPGLSEQMIVLDKNADGKLSAEEFAAVTIIPADQGITTEKEGASEPSTY
ncbi:MAG: EF-hand domain-containing protein [Gammaproteobacteria bacterium]